MTGSTLEFSSACFTVQAPEEVLEALRLFYPRSLVTESSTAPASKFVVRKTNSSWALLRDGRVIGSFGRLVHALLALEFQIENILISSTDGAFGLHAGGVVTDRGGWLIAGNSNTGKTSSTFHLLELGQSFLCEEIALYEPRTCRVRPHLQTLALDSHFLEDYRAAFEIEHGELIHLDETIARFVPHRMHESPIAVDAVLLPRFRPDESPALEAVSPASVLTEFLGYCFPPSRSEELLFDAVIELLEQARLYRVTYDSAKTARELYGELLAAAPAPAP